VARSRQGRHQTNHILTNQTNLSSEFKWGGIQHSLSTGFELIYEAQNQQNAQALTDTTLPASLQQPVANLYNPNVNDAFLDPPFKGAYAKGSTLSAAVYAFDTLKLSQAWLINAGVRWEKFHTETNGSTFTAATATTAETLAQNPPLSLTDSLVSWKLGAVFKPAANGSLYATVSNSYQPPGGANFALSNTATNQASPNLKPQEGSNVELGTKWDLFGGRLAATAAVYRSENKNELVSDGLTPPTFTQIGKRRVDGVELGLVGQLTQALNLSLGYAHMNPEILQGVANGANANQGGVIVFSPKNTFSSWVTYKLPLPGWTIGGGARYVDTVARSSNLAVTTNLLNTESYWVADAMLQYDVTKNFSLQLNVYNLFDETYSASLNNGGSRYIPGQPRNALLTANLSF
jgi:catecholate siderophore receptor